MVIIEKPLISVVAPMYNEEAVCLEFLDRVREVARSRMEKHKIELIVVDDGSEDRTLNLVCEYQGNHLPDVRVLQFEKNLGLEKAIHAGLAASKGDFVIVMDTDLQDPPEIIPDILEHLQRGNDAVHMMRQERNGDGRVKIAFAKTFYWIQSFFLSTNEDLANFKGLSREVVNKILNHPDKSTLFRVKAYDVAQLGVNLPYNRLVRPAGSSKYNFLRSLRLAFYVIKLNSKILRSVLLVSILNLLSTSFYIFYSYEIESVAVTVFAILALVLNLIVTTTLAALTAKSKNDETFVYPYTEVKSK